MSKLVVMGECMMELSHIDSHSLAKSFAGDVYNTALYAKRVFQSADVSFLTAVGSDALSDEFIGVLKAEGIGADLVYRDSHRTIGSYLVHVDERGERSFTYWRSDSAAKQTLKLIESDLASRCSDVNYFFYSGISLAILADEDRDKLWLLLETLRSEGVKIVFDPNYRPKLWAQTRDIKAIYERAFSLCDLLLPGIEDFEHLYGSKTADDVMSVLAAFTIPEVILKNGPEKVTCYVAGNDAVDVKITPVKHVVDTTSAGDSFNGAFLASRLQGKDIVSSVGFAASVAGEVIQHKGAIVPTESFVQFLSELRAS